MKFGILLRIDENDKKRPNSSTGKRPLSDKTSDTVPAALPIGQVNNPRKPVNKYKFKISDCKNVKVDFRKINR